MLIVNRSVDPVVTINYTIPHEDPKEFDEIKGARTHQFVAFCRDHSPISFPPWWISEADLDAAVAAELLDPESAETLATLETSAAWDQCWHRITSDDERRPITFEEAAKPVLWDTSDLAIGGYVVEGYTWDPIYNIWSFRPGVIKVVDSDELAQSPPAAAVEPHQDFTTSDEPIAFEVCHSTTDGSTLSASWSIANVNEIEWFPFVEDEPADGQSSTIEFLPPEETIGKAVMIRIIVTDPMDRQTTTYAERPIYVLKSQDEGDGECDSSFIDNANCETTGPTGSTGATSAGTDSDSQASATTTGQDAPGTCACRLDEPRPRAPLALLALVILCGRRRR